VIETPVKRVKVPEYMRLREVESNDHEWLVELHNDPNVLRNMTHPQPITLSSHMAWWERVSRDPKQLRLIYEINGARVGFAKFYDIDNDNNSCVLGADIHKDFRGQGYAKPLWTLMLQKCFNELELNRVSLTTAEYNTIGQHVYRSLGFKEEGRLISSLYRDGRYWDQICMYMLCSDWSYQ